MAFDVAHARGLFPSLGDGWAYLDPQAGMQIPASVATAVSTGFRSMIAAPGADYPAARASGDALMQARRAVADLLAAEPEGVVLGPSRGVLLGGLADALTSTTWSRGEVVVSRADDEPNIVPWLRGIDRHGGRARWAEVDVETGVLPIWQFDELLTEHTAVVAVTLASSTMGAVTDVRAIAQRAKEVGALLVVDATAAAPYVSLDMAALGADVVVVSAERWGGPRLAAMVFAEPQFIDGLRPIAMDPRADGPARLEVEAMQGGLLVGLAASIEHLADLDSDARGDRRRRLVSALDGVYEYLSRLYFYLMTTLEPLDHTHVVGSCEDVVPTMSFTVAGVAARKVTSRLADNGICAISDFPSRSLSRMGADDFGGAVTIGLSPYTTPFEIDHLVRTLGSFG